MSTITAVREPDLRTVCLHETFSLPLTG